MPKWSKGDRHHHYRLNGIKTRWGIRNLDIPRGAPCQDQEHLVALHRY